MSDSDTPPGQPIDFASAPALAGPTWQEQDSILSDLWRQNKTPQEIASVLGRSVGAIMTRAARLGLPRRSAPGRKPGSRNVTEGLEGRSYVARARAVSRSAQGQAIVEGQVIPQPSTRVCLMCLRSFQSMGRHNRICPSCKGSADYASAASTADIHFPI